MKKIHLPLILLAAMFLFGCRTTTKTRIFLLTGDESLQRLNSTDVKVEMRPIKLPNYLNRREFVKRVGEDEIQILRSWLWAETSEHSINVAFVQNLKALLGEDNVLPYGTAHGSPVLLVFVRGMEVRDGIFVADFHCRLEARLNGVQGVQAPEPPIVPAGDNAAVPAALAVLDISGGLLKLVEIDRGDKGMKKVVAVLVFENPEEHQGDMAGVTRHEFRALVQQ